MILPANSEVKKILLENANYKMKQVILAMESNEEHRVDSVMVSKIYELAINKSDIDFGGIPNSKGDITKFEGYTTMMETVDLIRSIASKSNTRIKELDIVEKAISNITLYKPQFTKGFLADKEIIIMLYNLLVTACVEATSYILSSYVDFIKTPTKVEFTLIKTNNNKGHISIDALEKFNLSVNTGEFAKVVNMISGDRENFLGGGTEALVLVPVVIIGGLSMLVPLMRELAYYFYYSRMKTSEFLKHQATLLEINKVAVKSSDLPAQKKKEVLRKQQELAKKMDQYADKIAVDSRGTEKMVKTNIEKDNKTLVFDDIKSDASSLDSGGFLL